VEPVLYLLWGAVVLLILALLIAVALSARSSAKTAKQPDFKADAPSMPVADTLLFYYEEQSARATADGQVVIRIPDGAWEMDWQADLLRIEVQHVDVDQIELPADWGETRKLSGYALRAVRMTELGNDIEVERFPATVDVAIGALARERGALRCALLAGENWVLPPKVDVGKWEGGEVLDGRLAWAATEIAFVGPVCLFQLPA